MVDQTAFVEKLSEIGTFKLEITIRDFKYYESLCDYEFILAQLTISFIDDETKEELFSFGSFLYQRGGVEIGELLLPIPLISKEFAKECYDIIKSANDLKRCVYFKMVNGIINKQSGFCNKLEATIAVNFLTILERISKFGTFMVWKDNTKISAVTLTIDDSLAEISFDWSDRSNLIICDKIGPRPINVSNKFKKAINEILDKLNLPANDNKKIHFKIINSKVISEFEVPELEHITKDKLANQNISQNFNNEKKCYFPPECTKGCHKAKEVIRNLYSKEWYEENGNLFDNNKDILHCISYLKRFQPQHIPQIDETIKLTLGHINKVPKKLHILDIGGGCGTLYLRLAHYLNTVNLDCDFCITLLEPSEHFHKFFNLIKQYVSHPRLTVNPLEPYNLGNEPDLLKEVNWFFIANSVSYIDPEVVLAAIERHRAKEGVTFLTISETYSMDYFSYFKTRDLIEEKYSIENPIVDLLKVDAPWLNKCEFFDTKWEKIYSILHYLFLPISD